MPSAENAFARHVAETGLTKTCAREELGWSVFEDASSLDKSFLPIPCFRIPYFTLGGYQRRNLFRVRYLGKPKHGKKWGSTTEEAGNGKAPRYAQPAGSPMEAYYPPLAEWWWYEIAEDPEVPVFITEGEKKAAAATNLGFPCIGLGGVWSFRDPLTKALLPSLQEFDWEGRQVFIVYDSDLVTKKEVRHALVELSKSLLEQKAAPLVVRLPSSDGKAGLDDFLREHGAAKFKELLADAEDLVQAEDLENYNERFCVITHPPEVRDLGDPDRSWLLTNDAFPKAFNQDRMRVFDGHGNPKLVPVAKQWMDWPGRMTATRAVFEPTLSAPICWIDGVACFNVFRGWGVPSVRGSTEVWQKLLMGVFSGSKERIRWFEQWLAYPIQHPGTKTYQATLLWGSGQGTGKSSIGRFLLRIYGRHGRELDDDAFASGFNGWAENTSFVMADDLASEHPRQLKSMLKRLITSEDVEVSRKYRESYRAKNHAQFLFTAQSNTAIPLDEASNRRWFIIRAPDEKPYPETWYTGEMDAYLRGDGPSHVRYRLEHLDLESYSPRGDAPETEDGLEAVAASSPEIAFWLQSLKNDPSAWLRERSLPEATDILVGDQLITFAKVELDRPATRLVLRDASKVLLRVGQSSPMPNGARPVFYAIRNAAAYKGNAAKARANHLKHFPTEFGVREKVR